MIIIFYNKTLNSKILSKKKKELDYEDETNIFTSKNKPEISSKKNNINMNVNDFDKYFNYILNDDILPIESEFAKDKNSLVITKDIENYIKLIENKKDFIKDEMIEAYSDGSRIENTTPTRFRKKIIQNLENFKFGDVEQKLQGLFQKYNKKGNVSPFARNCLTPMQNLIDDTSRLSNF